ncbi:cation:proton antiporter subunit C [Neorickettsia risticii]|uniref:Monovalent cation/proton antiporter, MnhC/PhaC subunit family n=1 Tax=Neorickettsia risticii (strain Illinois) TaxID=434131 RepID=C6V3R2_NEORI|nr:monovalent cation/proton antiporter, MnhC/PhaC subunit family [Neorickettsia risticii str. Illinois]
MFTFYNYAVVVWLMVVGLYIIMASPRPIKKLIGLGLFQSSVLLLYISLAYIEGAATPLISPNVENYVNPLPHVLMLTAIVVGVATLALGLTLVILMNKTPKDSNTKTPSLD